MPKIAPFLWFDDEAEEAAEFYVSVFNARPGSAGESEILEVARYPEGGPGELGSAMTVSFRLEGQQFTGLNGGPHHQFTEAVSFFVDCETQEEVDAHWSALSEGGEAGPCGWLKDRYGVSWQVVPKGLEELYKDETSPAAARTMEAMLKMKKLDIAGLEAAYEGRAAS
jgi:predicted 3-demethylubiquinone-9 3-methyltransferase (glyoxalase superfamily)